MKMTNVISWALAILLVGLTLPARADVSLDLRDADLKSFVQIVAEATGHRFILDPAIRGTVTVIAPGKMPPAAVDEIFLNVLALNHLTVVKGEEADRIVPMATARELSSGGGITLRGGAYETRVIEVKNISVAEVVDVIRPLLPQEAVLSTVPGSNILILSDRGDDQRRIAQLVAKLDRPRETPIEIVHLNNANAGEILQVIQTLEAVPTDAKLSLDARSNSLLVTGSDSFRTRVRTIAARLDTPQTQLASRVVQLNYADATTLGDVILRSVGGALPDAKASITIVPAPSTNALLVTAPADQINRIVAAIHGLDRRPRQVLVEAVVFEMSVDGFSDLSVQFGGVLNDAIGGGVQFSLDGRQTLTGLISAVRNKTVPDPGNGATLAFRNGGGNGRIAGFLTAIASQHSTRLLATPSILTLNNQEAQIVVAQNVPFVTGSYKTVSGTSVDQPFQTIERQDVGLTMKVTPDINADDTVRMAISQEVSNLTNATSAAGGEITAKRTLTTNVLVQDGNVIMLGGLLEDGSDSTAQKVPGLGNLPVIGGLFRGKHAGTNRRVLLVLLRPRIIRSDRDATRLTLASTQRAHDASLAIQPRDGGRYPATPDGTLPFDGANLNQPFDAGFSDDVAKRRKFPSLPTRIQFRDTR